MGKENLIEEIQHIQDYIRQSLSDDYYGYEDNYEFKKEFCQNNALEHQLNGLINWIIEDKHLSEGRC